MVKVITTYTTLVGGTADKLDEAVTDYLKQGYQPFGNPYTTIAHNEFSGKDKILYHQAMVKYDDT